MISIAPRVTVPDVSLCCWLDVKIQELEHIRFYFNWTSCVACVPVAVVYWSMVILLWVQSVKWECFETTGEWSFIDHKGEQRGGPERWHIRLARTCRKCANSSIHWLRMIVLSMLMRVLLLGGKGGLLLLVFLFASYWSSSWCSHVGSLFPKGEQKKAWLVTQCTRQLLTPDAFMLSVTDLFKMAAPKAVFSWFLNSYLIQNRPQIDWNAAAGCIFLIPFHRQDQR